MDRLHGGDDAQRSKALHVVQVQNLGVLNAVAQVPANARFARGRNGIQHVAVGLVADGVNVDGQPGAGGPVHLLHQMLGGGHGNAKVVRFVLVMLHHERRARAQRTIGKYH